MKKNYTAKVSISINAPPARVWEGLTKPDLIKQYFFGTEVTTNWKVGSPIVYKGTWEGKTYEDKGKILENEPERLLISTYWSSMSGLADVPANYKKVRYDLSPEGRGTKLTVTQDNNATKEEADHSEKNWRIVLEGLKKLLES